MSDEFEDLITDSLHSRAAEMPVAARGVHDVRRRVRLRRHRRVAATMLPALAGVSYFGMRATGDDGQRVLGPDPSASPISSPDLPTVPTALASSVPTSTAIADPAAQNFLIVGSDANACVDPSSPWAGAADPAREDRGNRSDTIVVMRLDPTTHAASMLSFPRDLWVDIPGRGKGRINGAYVENDYSLLAQTIYDNFGIAVDHYIQIDFCAFKRIVDAVGGVAVPFSTRVVDRHVGLDIAPGCHTFSGDEALAYVRSRHLSWIDDQGTAHEDGTSDLGRISRQQDFMLRTLQAAMESGLLDPAVARALLEALQTDIVTEAGFTVDDMLALAAELRALDPTAIGTYQIEATGITVSGNSVLQAQLDTEQMQSVLAVFRGGTIPPDSSVPPSATGSPAPSSDRKGDILPDPTSSCD